MREVERERESVCVCVTLESMQPTQVRNCCNNTLQLSANTPTKQKQKGKRQCQGLFAFSLSLSLSLCLSLSLSLSPLLALELSLTLLFSPTFPGVGSDAELGIGSVVCLCSCTDKEPAMNLSSPTSPGPRRQSVLPSRYTLDQFRLLTVKQGHLYALPEGSTYGRESVTRCATRVSRRFASSGCTCPLHLARETKSRVALIQTHMLLRAPQVHIWCSPSSLMCMIALTLDRACRFLSGEASPHSHFEPRCSAEKNRRCCYHPLCPLLQPW